MGTIRMDLEMDYL